MKNTFKKFAVIALSSMMGIGKQEVYSALSSLGLPESARIEQLDMDQLIQLSQLLMNK